MTTPSQYAALDKTIIDRLTEKPAHFVVLAANPGIIEEAQRLADLTGRECFRIIDGRLIALRKAGKIKPNRLQGWSLA